MTSDSSPFAEEAPTEAEAVRRDEALDAARLSHDRGADAEGLPGPFDVHDHGCTCWPHVSAGPAQEAVIEAARQEYVAGRSRSVPAPTLPALDALRELSEKATPGPWSVRMHVLNHGYDTIGNAADNVVADAYGSNAAFILACVEYVRKALRDAV